MTTRELGTWFTVMIGGSALVSIYMGAALASRYAANNERLQFKVVAAAYLGWGIDHGLLFLSPSRDLALVLVGLGAFVNATTGPVLAAIQSLVPPRMRGTSVAILSLSANLASGLGPLVAGALSDALHPIFGRQSLRFALLALCPGLAWGAWRMWQAGGTVTFDLDTLRQGSESRHAREPVSP